MRLILAIVLPISLACGGAGLVADSPEGVVVDGQPNGLALGVCVELNERCGLVDRDGRWVVAPEFRQVPDRCEEACILKDTNYNDVFVDVRHDEVKIVDVQAAEVSRVSEGLFVAWPDADGESGQLMTLDGTLLGSPDIEQARFPHYCPRRGDQRWAPGRIWERHFAVSEGLALVCRPACDYVRTDGSVAFSVGRVNAWPVSDGVAVVAGGMRDASGEVIETDAEVLTPFYSGHALGWVDVRDGPEGAEGDDVIIDTTGRITARVSGFKLGLGMVFSGGRVSTWSEDEQMPVWLGTDGTITRPPDGTELLWPLIEDRGLYGVGDRVGYLGESGTVAIPMDFATPTKLQSEHAHFSEGLAVARPASAPGLAGYLNPDGSWAIEPSFEDARRFQEGVARVTVGDITTWIRKDGTFLMPPDDLPPSRTP
ncbi:MAG: hypothetical protein ACJATT_004153 [Myxococcota bacterium]|jgi:hypothetical protein